MGKKKIRGEGQDYDEVKANINIALTPTAKKLLQERVKAYGCRSISDLIEKWAFLRDCLELHSFTHF